LNGGVDELVRKLYADWVSLTMLIAISKAVYWHLSTEKFSQWFFGCHPRHRVSNIKNSCRLGLFTTESIRVSSNSRRRFRERKCPTKDRYRIEIGCPFLYSFLLGKQKKGGSFYRMIGYCPWGRAFFTTRTVTISWPKCLIVCSVA